MPDLDHHDFCIIGAGVIGLAIARNLSIHPAYKNCSVVLLEQHARFGEETSSRNSEVIHAGIYYPRGSLKTRLCIEGRQQLYHYCKSFNIPHKKTGKLIIANNNQETALEHIQQQAVCNGVNNLELIEGNRLLELEPMIKADKALLSPSSGIIDSHAYMQSLLHQAENAGTIFAPLTSSRYIEQHSRGFLVNTLCQDADYSFTCTNLINSAGLSAQKVAAQIADFPATAIPLQSLVKGSYFSLQGKAPFSHLVYPVPEENLRGLGVHVTLDMAGQVKFGPDTEAVNHIDYAVDTSKEMKFRQAIEQYFPAISDYRIQPAYSGIRPKLQIKQGIADFIIQNGRDNGYEGLVQLYGIESPGLTASLAIADETIKRLAV